MADCLSSLQLTASTLADISACQAAANTPFCFPPNGTRICAPADKIPFYWPQGYYNDSSKVMISWEPSGYPVVLQDNTGNGTLTFTTDMYEAEAVDIPGVQNERSMKMAIRERREDDSNPFNLALHEGPTVVLVKTEASPSRTTVLASSEGVQATAVYTSPTDGSPSRTTVQATPEFTGPIWSTHDPEDDDDDDRPKLHAGAIAGIVIGAIAAAILLLFCCCRRNGCCGAKARAKDAEGTPTQNYVIEQGNVVQPQQEVLQKPIPVVAEVPPAKMSKEKYEKDGIETVDELPPPKYTA